MPILAGHTGQRHAHPGGTYWPTAYPPWPQAAVYAVRAYERTLLEAPPTLLEQGFHADLEEVVVDVTILPRALGSLIARLASEEPRMQTVRIMFEGRGRESELPRFECFVGLTQPFAQVRGRFDAFYGALKKPRMHLEINKVEVADPGPANQQVGCIVRKQGLTWNDLNVSREMTSTSHRMVEEGLVYALVIKFEVRHSFKGRKRPRRVSV